MSTEQVYLIANLAGASERPGGLALCPFASGPRFAYHDRAAANKELLRLQALNPRAEFVLFEAIAEAVPGLQDRGSLEIVELTQ